MPAFFDTGFSVREPMWHGQGLVLDDYPEDWADARAKAGLTWEPRERTPYDLRPEVKFRNCRECGVSQGGQHVADCTWLADEARTKAGWAVTVIQDDCLPLGAFVTPAGVFVPIGDHKLIARSDNDLVLGVRSAGFATIYHGREDEFGNVVTAAEGRASMEEILDAFTTADGKIRFETAGSCRDGREVWALVYLDEPYVVPGDSTETMPFLALLNPHAGGGACKATATQVRVVCWNTFQMASAEGDRTGMQFTFRHIGDVAERIEEAKATIAGLRLERDSYLDLAGELTKLNVSDPQVEAFLHDFLPSPRENGEQCSDRVQANVDKARGMFKRIYFDSVTCEGIRGTGYGLLQASTEYLDHSRAYRSTDTYLGRSILGVEPVKARALNLIRSIG